MGSNCDTVPLIEAVSSIATVGSDPGLVVTDDDLDRLDFSAAGFAHADAADLFGDVVLSANNFEVSAAADGTDQPAIIARAFVVAIENVCQLAHWSPPPL